MSTTDAELVRADPAFRRRFLGVVLLLAAAGAAALVALHFHLEATSDLARDDPAQAIEHMLWLLEVLSAATAVSLILFGLYGLRLATRVYRAERYPLAEQRVLRDTPVTVGAAAQRRALAIGATSALLLVAGVLLPYAISRVVGRLTEVRKKIHAADRAAAGDRAGASARLELLGHVEGRGSSPHQGGALSGYLSLPSVQRAQRATWGVRERSQSRHGGRVTGASKR